MQRCYTIMNNIYVKLPHFSKTFFRSTELLRWPIAIDWLASYVNIFNFLKTTRPIVTIFALKQLYGKKNIYYENHGSTFPVLTPVTFRTGDLRAGPNVQKSSLLPYIWGKSLMHWVYVYEALYKNSEIHGPCVNGLSSRVRSMTCMKSST